MLKIEAKVQFNSHTNYVYNLFNLKIHLLKQSNSSQNRLNYMIIKNKKARRNFYPSRLNH